MKKINIKININIYIIYFYYIIFSQLGIIKITTPMTTPMNIIKHNLTPI